MRFLADEDFNHDILRGLKRRHSQADIVSIQELGLRGTDDDGVLERAATDGRIVLTHDIATLVGRALERVRAGHAMPGVLAVPQALAVGAAIDDLSLIVECSSPVEWSNLVSYLPLR